VAARARAGSARAGPGPRLPEPGRGAGRKRLRPSLRAERAPARDEGEALLPPARIGDVRGSGHVAQRARGVDGRLAGEGPGGEGGGGGGGGLTRRGEKRPGERGSPEGASGTAPISRG